MPYGWEGNRPCITEFSGLSTFGLNGLREGDEHPAYTPVKSMASFAIPCVPEQNLRR